MRKPSACGQTRPAALNPNRWPASLRALTVVEVMFSMGILALALMGILAVQMQSRRLTEGSIYQNTVLTIVQGYLEQIKNMPITDVVNFDSSGNHSLASSYAVLTKYDDNTNDYIYTSTLNTVTKTPPAVSSITPGTTPADGPNSQHVQDNLRGFDMAKDSTATSMTSTDTGTGDVSTQVTWQTIWPGATDYTTSCTSRGAVTTTTGRNDMHMNIWIWVQDLKGSSTATQGVYGITVMYNWQYLDGNRPRYTIGSVRTIRSVVPSW
jgi:Tfp pilus assembly protein PilV